MAPAQSKLIAQGKRKHGKSHVQAKRNVRSKCLKSAQATQTAVQPRERQSAADAVSADDTSSINHSPRGLNAHRMTGRGDASTQDGNPATPIAILDEDIPEETTEE